MKEPTVAGVGLVSGSTSAEVDVKQSVVKRLVAIEVDEPPMAEEVDVKEPTEAGVGLVSGSTSAEFDVKQSVVKRLVAIEVDEPPKRGVKVSPTPVAEKLLEATSALTSLFAADSSRVLCANKVL